MDRVQLQGRGFRELSWQGRPAGVYCLLLAGKVVYVGQSKNVLGRLGAHVRVRTSRLLADFGKGARSAYEDRPMHFDEIQVYWCEAWRLDHIEEELIRFFRPKHNLAIRAPLPNLPCDLAKLGLGEPQTLRRRKVA